MNLTMHSRSADAADNYPAMMLIAQRITRGSHPVVSGF
jgi:hypothetical protein